MLSFDHQNHSKWHKWCHVRFTGVSVIVVNGDRVAYRGLARNVATRIGDEFFEIDCYAIPLDCYDMVLGTSFLRMLGPILWDFDDLCMAFTHK